MTTFTDTPRVYDFVKWEIDQRYTRVAATIQNKAGVAIDAGAIKIGQPLILNGSQWETADSGEEASVDGFFVDERKVPALAVNGISTLEYSILVRGPALVNYDAIPVDLLGVAYGAAAIKAALRALSPRIEFLLEPTNETVQST